MMDYTAAREAMVDCQIRPNDVTKYPIIAAFLSVPREHYVPREKAAIAYVGSNLPLGSNRVLLEPRTMAKMLDALDLTQDDLVLDIASASGYSSAIIAQMAQAVVGLESDAQLIEQSSQTIIDQEIYNAIIIKGAVENGAQKHGPYDAMIVQGGIEQFPDTLHQQLKDGGRVVAIFQNGPLGQCRIGIKSNGQITWRNLFDASAPLLPEFAKKPEFCF